MIFILWTQSWAAGQTKRVHTCICNPPSHGVPGTWTCKPCSSWVHRRCCRSHVHLLHIHLTSSGSKLVLQGSAYCSTVPLCCAPPHFDLLPLDKVANARAKGVSPAFQNKMTEHINEYSHQSASILHRHDEPHLSPHITSPHSHNKEQ